MMEKQGFAFGDFISTEKIRKHAGGYDEKDLSFGRQGGMRGFFLFACGALAILVIFFRLFYLLLSVQLLLLLFRQPLPFLLATSLIF